MCIINKSKKQSISHDNGGFTLLELLVSIGIFSLVVLSVLGIFQQVINVQRKAINSQNTNESLRFAMELISKEIRTAERNFGACLDIPYGEIFEVSGGALYLKNQNGECVAYFRENNRFKIARDGTELYVTPNEVVVNYLNFSEGGGQQPAVTVMMGVSSSDTTSTKAEMEIQTTISSRYYIEDKIL